MYLTIDTIYNINEIPSENFDKPYLIKGGCKNMAIFKKKTIKHRGNNTQNSTGTNRNTGIVARENWEPEGCIINICAVRLEPNTIHLLLRD